MVCKMRLSEDGYRYAHSYGYYQLSYADTGCRLIAVQTFATQGRRRAPANLRTRYVVGGRYVRKSNLCKRHCLALDSICLEPYMLLSIRPPVSHGWISQRFKLGLCNYHRKVAYTSSSCGIGFIHKFSRIRPERRHQTKSGKQAIF